MFLVVFTRKTGSFMSIIALIVIQGDFSICGHVTCPSVLCTVNTPVLLYCTVKNFWLKIGENQAKKFWRPNSSLKNTRYSELRYSRFCTFFGSFYGIKWLIWDRFTFKLVCPSIFNINANDGQNKFEFHTLQNVA